jgi:hypothetical protein
MSEQIDNMVNAEWVTRANVFFGGKSGVLKNLSAERNLYIICHGNRSMPVFQTNAGRWTAEQMVKLLEKSGLKKEHRNIELIVCHAGASVSTNDQHASRTPLYDQLWKLKEGSTKHTNKLEEVKKVLGNSGPSEFTDPSTQLYPLAAQFAWQLKKREYTNFCVKSYALSVSQTFLVDGLIRLTTTGKVPKGKWGDDRPDIVKSFTFEWR